MKQKYAIIRDDDQKTLIVREYAELDKEMMSLLCEETYSQEVIAAAVKQGRQEVVDALRTNNMYPPTVFADPLAKAIEELFADGGNQSAELFFDDKELFIKEVEPVEEEPEEEVEEDVAVDDLLEENIEEEYSNDNVVKEIKSKIKVTDGEDESAKNLD